LYAVLLDVTEIVPTVVAPLKIWITVPSSLLFSLRMALEPNVAVPTLDVANG